MSKNSVTIYQFFLYGIIELCNTIFLYEIVFVTTENLSNNANFMQMYSLYKVYFYVCFAYLNILSLLYLYHCLFNVNRQLKIRLILGSSERRMRLQIPILIVSAQIFAFLFVVGIALLAPKTLILSAGSTLLFAVIFFLRLTLIILISDLWQKKR